MKLTFWDSSLLCSNVVSIVKKCISQEAQQKSQSIDKHINHIFRAPAQAEREKLMWKTAQLSCNGATGCSKQALSFAVKAKWVNKS